MSELYFQAPTSEEQSATYRGMTFKQFRQLSDGEVAQLRLQERDEFLTVCEAHGLFSDEWNVATTKLETFSNFKEWRRHGVPDRDMSYEEWDERVAHYVDIRRTADSAYGTLSNIDVAHLTEAEYDVMYLALDENDPPDGAQPIVQVGGTIEDALKHHKVTYDDLVAKGVLEPYRTQETVMFNSGIGYALAGKFGEFVLAQPYIYREEQKEAR